MPLPCDLGNVPPTLTKPACSTRGGFFAFSGGGGKLLTVPFGPGLLAAADATGGANPVATAAQNFLFASGPSVPDIWDTRRTNAGFGLNRPRLPVTARCSPTFNRESNTLSHR
jgi:hypothetical protein